MKLPDEALEVLQKYREKQAEFQVTLRECSGQECEAPQRLPRPLKHAVH